MTPQGVFARFCLICVVPISCATPQNVDANAPTIFEILPTAGSPFAVDASDQIAPMDVDWTWQLVDKKGRTTNDPPIHARASPTELHGAMWMIPMIGGDREFVAQGSAGEISLVVVEAPNDRVISIFTPPLILAPSKMQPNEIFISSSSMRIDWMDGRGERDRGVGERTAHAIRPERIRTPLGEFETMRVETKFEATLRFAKAQRTTTLWIASGVGPIAEEWREQVTVLGIPISNEAGSAVRISPP